MALEYRYFGKYAVAQTPILSCSDFEMFDLRHQQPLQPELLRLQNVDCIRPQDTHARQRASRQYLLPHLVEGVLSTDQGC